MTEINYWLMKSEPDAYSIDTLKNDGVTLWDGIRNYQARNFMRKMNKGDKVFFYHSNCKPPGIVGLMEVIDLNIVDPTQFDKDSKYFDPKSKPNNPRWDCVKVKYKSKSDRILRQKPCSGYPSRDRYHCPITKINIVRTKGKAGYLV